MQREMVRERFGSFVGGILPNEMPTEVEQDASGAVAKQQTVKEPPSEHPQRSAVVPFCLNHASDGSQVMSDPGRHYSVTRSMLLNSHVSLPVVSVIVYFTACQTTVSR